MCAPSLHDEFLTAGRYVRRHQVEVVANARDAGAGMSADFVIDVTMPDKGEILTGSRSG